MIIIAMPLQFLVGICFLKDLGITCSDPARNNQIDKRMEKLTVENIAQRLEVEVDDIENIYVVSSVADKQDPLRMFSTFVYWHC